MTDKINLPDGIKLSLNIAPEPTDEELIFARQLGIDHVYTWVGGHQRDYEFLINLRRRVESFDLTLFNVGNMDVGKSDKIHLALRGRDEVIEDFKKFILNLGRAGIHTTTFTWEPAGVHSTEKQKTRGGSLARAVNMEVLNKRPPTHSGDYSEEDIWNNYTYFIKEIIPVAEEAGVRLALHPNDPPVPEIGGIPCLIHSFESYKRAFEIGSSDYLGMEFCSGCWLEGGENFGDILEAIKYFVERGKVFIVHFRNVSSPLPHFVETFVDDGYMDMYSVMKAFQEAGYRGTMILDHTPEFVPGAGKEAATAYAIGYMKALLARALAGGE